ncbi:acetoacetate decarboxylase family protein [Humibacillus xanthopallidus]|uniref:Acetoacetate decarboxylase n=1 Tax=Humibacillus xanthopallidus TaxID=412689 RepID=A0A543HUC3_9MICO|nr:acetoacetate decarboxylase family protein [Humibacillus xanthopallidus]TQM61874.1 acetoacetate decarboxylase [Humibacillus xanthopallidus]
MRRWEGWTRSGRDATFFDWAGERPVAEFRGRVVRGPTAIHRIAAFQTLHLAAFDPVRAAIPTGDLRPVRWFDGRAVVFVSAMRHQDVTASYDGGEPYIAPPYGEVSVGVIVSRRPAPRGLPVFGRSVRGFVLHMPVTTAIAAESGRLLLGYPKFVSDMDFVDEPARRSVTVSESGREILTVRVMPSGRVTTNRAPVIMYSVLDGQLLESTVRFFGHRQTMMGSASGHLAFGDHPVGDELRGLRIDTSPIMAASYLDARMLFGAGIPVGTGHPYRGYVGQEPERGRYTVAYPDTPPLNQYTVPLDMQSSVHGPV